jgi:hypothetical protein
LTARDNRFHSRGLSLHAQVAQVEGLAARHPAGAQLNALCPVVLSFQAATHRHRG